jgi:hypothetical protein
VKKSPKKGGGENIILKHYKDAKCDAIAGFDDKRNKFGLVIFAI